MNNNNKTSINCDFELNYKIEDNGMYSWNIPFFDIFFSSEDFESGKVKADLMIKAFIKYHINDATKSDVQKMIDFIEFPLIENQQYVLKVGDHISISPIKHEDLLKCIQDFISLHNQKEKSDLPIYKKQL